MYNIYFQYKKSIVGERKRSDRQKMQASHRLWSSQVPGRPWINKLLESVH